MSKTLLITLLFVFPQLANSEEIDKEYQQILFGYASSALMEFQFLNPSNSKKSFDIEDAFFVKGTDKINRIFYVVLFPDNGGSTYVSLELNKDGYLEVHGRGGVNVKPAELKSNFKDHIGKMIHYPGSS